VKVKLVIVFLPLIFNPFLLSLLPYLVIYKKCLNISFRKFPLLHTLLGIWLKRRVDVLRVPHKSLKCHHCPQMLLFILSFLNDLLIPFVNRGYLFGLQQLNRLSVKVVSAVHGIGQLLLVLTLKSLHVLLVVLHLVVVKAVGGAGEGQRLWPVKFATSFF
jgi:hypothetical protein